MIQNKTILDKLDKKTENDPVMRAFIADIFDRESEGKHFGAYYKEQIARNAKIREED